MWRERQDFEINKSAKGWKTISRQNGHSIYTVFLKRLSSILELYCLEELNIYSMIILTENYHTDLFLLLKKCARNVRSLQHSAAIFWHVLFYERKDSPLKGDSEATINSLSSEKYLDTLKNTFVERSSQNTAFSPRKMPANAGSERKQFTENASVALQQTILTHAHTKCPPVLHYTNNREDHR